MDTREQTASTHPIGTSSGEQWLAVEPGRAVDLRPFDRVLPLLSKDVESLYGRRCRLAPRGATDRLSSHVLRVGVWHDGDSGPLEHLFVKVSKYKVVDGASNGMRVRVEKDFAVTQQVFERMANRTHYDAVRPVACYPAHLAIVTEEIPGETLLDRVQHEIRWAFSPSRAEGLSKIMYSAGRWIRDFQQPTDDTVTQTWIREYIDSRLQRIAEATGTRGRQMRDKVLRHIDTVSRQITQEAVAAVTVHADLSPSNIMVSNGRIVVLDFAMARTGHPLQDVARLFTQLDLLAIKAQYRHTVIEPLQRALLAGFEPTLQVTDPAFRLQVLAQRVNHLGSLSTRKYAGLERIYNRFVVHHHWRWIEREADPDRSGRSKAWG